MALYLVKAGDKPLWVMHDSADSDGDPYAYVYVQNTGKFHRNDALGEDYFVDRELSYEPLTSDTARDIITAGQVGFLKPEIKAEQLKRYVDDTRALEAPAILNTEP